MKLRTWIPAACVLVLATSFSAQAATVSGWILNPNWYAPLWEGNYREFGQTFAATGSSGVMVVVRSAVSGVVTTASIHDGGPTGAQIGPSRTATLSGGPSDYRYVWNGGEVPTVPGHIY